MVVKILSFTGPASSHLPWETGILDYVFKFHMGSVSCWRAPPFSTDYRKTQDNSHSCQKHLVLMVQVTQDETESLRTSAALNRREPGATSTSWAVQLSVSKFTAWSCPSALPVSSKQSGLITASQHGYETGSAPQPQDQQPVPCSPSFKRHSRCSTWGLKVTMGSSSHKNSPSFPIRSTIKQFGGI